MNCPVLNGNPDVLLEYTARNLNPDTESVLARHMAICPECARFAEAQKQVWSALDAWEAAPVSPSFDDKLYACIDAQARLSFWAQARLSFWAQARLSFWAQARLSFWAQARRSFWTRVLGGQFAWKLAASFAGALATLAVAAVLVAPPGRVEQPAVAVSPETSRVETLEVEQVERTLEDLEMLRQLGGGAAAGGNSQAL